MGVEENSVGVQKVIEPKALSSIKEYIAKDILQRIYCEGKWRHLLCGAQPKLKCDQTQTFIFTLLVSPPFHSHYHGTTISNW